MLFPQVVDHAGNLGKISLPLGWNCSSFECRLWWGLKAISGDEVGLSVQRSRLSPLILLHHITLHWVEVALVSGVVEGWGFSHGEVSLTQPLLLLRQSHGINLINCVERFVDVSLTGIEVSF